MHWSRTIGFNKNFFHHCLLKKGANVLSTIPMLTRQVSNGRRPSLFNFFNLLNCINNSGGGPKKEWILIIPFMTFLTRHEWMKILNVPAGKPPIFVFYKQHLAKSNNLSCQPSEGRAKSIWNQISATIPSHWQNELQGDITIRRWAILLKK